VTIGYFGASRIDALQEDISRVEHWIGLIAVAAVIIVAAWVWLRYRR